MSLRRYGHIFQTSLVIFAMLFGAGNLIFPLKVGLISGEHTLWGLAGFILTGVLLPLLGLLAIITFDGDYKAFFGRVGKIPGELLIFFCMMALGPLVVMPRIITLSYEMIRPFLPFNIPVSIFAVFFLALVFLATYRPRRLLTLIGSVLSPLKLLSLSIIIIPGLFSGSRAAPTALLPSELFASGARYGYLTLDLLGTIFFGSIVVKLLSFEKGEKNVSNRMQVAFYAAIGAAILLGVIYLGMGFLGAFHGQGLENINPGQLFSDISFRILGHYGAALIGFTVFLACFTTTIALTAVVADYVSGFVPQRKHSYTSVLIGILGITLIPASLGLSAILKFSEPLIVALYPVIIAVTVCNVLYKLFGFRMIKLPVFLTLLFVIIKALTLR